MLCDIMFIRNFTYLCLVPTFIAEICDVMNYRSLERTLERAGPLLH